MKGFISIDEDKCKEGNNECHVNATCSNTEGSYICSCNEGFTGDGTTCTDVDECEIGSNACNMNANCSNIEGSYICSCKEGFTGDGIICQGKSTNN